MFSKNVSELVYADIEDIVNVRKEREGYHLDYKTAIGNPDRAKSELAKDISAFANSNGGFLILGVDNNLQLTGIDDTIQNKPVDEWINQVLASNVEPHVFYFDPKVIKIPGSDKVIVVIHVPESTKKPHIVSDWNTYHIRINDSIKPARHYQIRDMFEFSKNREKELEDFLRKRNLLDENLPDFGMNNNSTKLFSEVPQKLKMKKPLVLFSLAPKYPKEEKIVMPLSVLKTWLHQNSSGYEPYPSLSLFYGQNDYDPKIDGIVLKHQRNNQETSYFEISNNGFVESGLSSSLISVYSDQSVNKLNVYISLTATICYEMMLLSFAKKFYSFIDLYDEVFFQISFVNVMGFMPWGLHKKFNSGFHGVPPVNKHYQNFKLSYPLNPSRLNEDEILKIAKTHAERLCRAFGLSHDYCFVDDKLSVDEMQHFYL